MPSARACALADGVVAHLVERRGERREPRAAAPARIAALRTSAGPAEPSGPSPTSSTLSALSRPSVGIVNVSPTLPDDAVRLGRRHQVAAERLLDLGHARPGRAAAEERQDEQVRSHVGERGLREVEVRHWDDPSCSMLPR